MKIKIKHQSKVSRGIVKKVETIRFDNLGAFISRKRKVWFI